MAWHADASDLESARRGLSSWCHLALRACQLSGPGREELLLTGVDVHAKVASGLSTCVGLAVTVSIRFDTCWPRSETSKLIVPCCDVVPA
jgi:hypothetical protein